PSGSGTERWRYTAVDADNLNSVTPGYIDINVNAGNPAPLLLVRNSVDVVWETELQYMESYAKSILQAAGLTTAQTTALNQLTFSLSDAAGTFVTSSSGSQVLIDRDGGGHGWFIDATPNTNEEFATVVSATSRAAQPGSPAYGRLDLLTAMTHEMALAIGIQPSQAPDLLSTSLDPGTRKLVGTLASAQLSTLRAANGFHYAGSYSQNAQGQNEKWFQDRNNAFYAILPSGVIKKYNNSNVNTSPVFATVDASVWADPTLLFNAPITLSSATQTQLSSLRSANGFQFVGSFYQSAQGLNEKWFQNRQGQWFAILPTGTILRFNGTSLATSSAVTQVDAVVF